MTERRKFMRLKSSMALLYTVSKGMSVRTGAILKDISREGLRMFTPRALEKGDIAEFYILLPGTDSPIYALGEIVWSRQSDDSSYDTGVRLKDIKSDDRRELIDYVYHQLVKR